MPQLPASPNGAYHFRHPLVERLSRTHIALPIALFLSLAAGLFAYAQYYSLLPFGRATALFLLGLVGFTLFEYLMHRYVFHMSTHTRFRARVQHIFHGVHHAVPKDKDRLAMPPLMSITLATLLFMLFRWAMGAAAFAFLPGFLTGYALYLLVHYVVHAYRPPRNAFRVLWTHHAIHHYKDDQRAFGVSSPLWDYVFGTMPLRGTAATSRDDAA